MERQDLESLAADAAAEAFGAEESELASLLAEAPEEFCRHVAAHVQSLSMIGASVEAVLPAPAVRSAILAAIPNRGDFAEVAAKGARRTTQAAEGWRDHPLPGVRFKELARNVGGTATLLMEMSAGARFPAHAHHGRETCYVVSGSFFLGGDLHRAGDFIDAPAGSRDEEIFTEHGTSFLLAVSRHDYIW